MWKKIVAALVVLLLGHRASGFSAMLKGKPGPLA
jgi:hypothetical protein